MTESPGASPYQLHIYPQADSGVIESCKLIELLKNRQFIGEKEADNRFLVGGKFLDNITFLGCSPDLNLYPDPNKPGKPYCYVEISAPEKNTRFFAGSNVKTPRCKACGNDLSRLPEQLKQLTDFSFTLCSHCGSSIKADELNWRRTAYFARQRLVIGNIYESEAVPGQNLLDFLHRETGFDWKYSYIRLS